MLNSNNKKAYENIKVTDKGKYVDKCRLLIYYNGLIFKIDKELLHLEQNLNNLIKIQTKDFNRHFLKEDIQVNDRCIKKCSMLHHQGNANSKDF